MPDLHAELAELLAKATPRDWRLMIFEEGPTICGCDGGGLAEVPNEANAALIVWFRNNADAILKALKEATNG